MPKQDDVDSIVQNFVADELSSLDKFGSDSKSLQLSPKYTQPERSPVVTQQSNSPKRQSSSSLFNSKRSSTTPSEASQETKQPTKFGDKLKSFRRIASGKKS